MKRLCGIGLVSLLMGCASVSESDRGQAAMHRQLAELKLQKNEISLAIREYEKALGFNERDPEAHFGLSEAFRRRGDLAEAEEHLLRALRLDPSHHDARLNLGVVYLQQERWDEAIAQNDILLEDATFLRPSRARVNRGWAYYQLGDLDAAEKDFRDALDQDPANHFARLDLGILLYSRGDVIEAIQQFDKVLEVLAPQPAGRFAATEAETRFRLAEAHVKLGHHGKAIQHLKIAAERGGKSKWGRKSRAYLDVLE